MIEIIKKQVVPEIILQKHGLATIISTEDLRMLLVLAYEETKNNSSIHYSNDKQKIIKNALIEINK